MRHSWENGIDYSKKTIILPLRSFEFETQSWFLAYLIRAKELSMRIIVDAVSATALNSKINKAINEITGGDYSLNTHGLEEIKKNFQSNKNSDVLYAIDYLYAPSMLVWIGANIKHPFLIDGFLFEDGECKDFFYHDTQIKTAYEVIKNITNNLN